MPAEFGEVSVGDCYCDRGGAVAGFVGLLAAAGVLYFTANKAKMKALSRAEAKVVSQFGRSLRFRTVDVKTQKRGVATLVFKGREEVAEVRAYLES